MSSAIDELESDGPNRVARRGSRCRALLATRQMACKGAALRRPRPSGDGGRSSAESMIGNVVAPSAPHCAVSRSARRARSELRARRARPKSPFARAHRHQRRRDRPDHSTGWKPRRQWDADSDPRRVGCMREPTADDRSTPAADRGGKTSARTLVGRRELVSCVNCLCVWGCACVCLVVVVQRLRWRPVVQEHPEQYRQEF
jgi:hypothetical protein